MKNEMNKKEQKQKNTALNTNVAALTSGLCMMKNAHIVAKTAVILLCHPKRIVKLKHAQLLVLEQWGKMKVNVSLGIQQTQKQVMKLWKVQVVKKEISARLQEKEQTIIMISNASQNSRTPSIAKVMFNA